MARVISVLFVCFLLFSTLWAVPVGKLNGRWKGHSVRSVLQRTLAERALAKLPAKLGGAITCDGCQLVIAWAENQLANNATEADIENFLNTTLCMNIPSVVRAECENIVDAYFPELVALILSRENPTTACTQIKLCP